MRLALPLTCVLLLAAPAAKADTITHPVATPAEDVWRIDQPTVDAPLTDFPSIQFVANDSVVVSAGGCVQTGGTGNTWKLYVNPQGPNSGSFYHGLIQFPAATLPGAPVRIGTIVGQTLSVPANSPGGHLKLGYEDNDYSDNGYSDHDDGTGDQCKNVGPAFVIVDIHHNSPLVRAAGSQLPFDLVWNESDDNGFPLNPIWAPMATDITKLPDPSACETKPQNFSDPACSTQSPSIDLPTGWNATWCAWTGSAINGHVNWFPVTYVGTIEWSDHSGNDDDYNFNFSTPGGEADVINQGQLGLEFDSDETIDHFDTPWWNEFHDAVDSSDTLAKALVLPTTQAVVAGLLGLDCDHPCRTEIHPVYSLAMPVFDPSDHSGLGGEVWAMFLRNFGNEGYCSSKDHKIANSTLSIRVPWKAGATNVTILNKPDNSDGFFKVNDPSLIGPIITVIRRQGILVQFQVPPGLDHAMANGELHLRWDTNPAGTAIMRAAVLAAAARRKPLGERDMDGAESRLERAYAGLPAASRLIAAKWVRPAREFRAFRARPPRGPVEVAELPTRLVRVPPRDIAAAATFKLAKDRARAGALCAAYKRGRRPVPAACNRL